MKAISLLFTVLFAWTAFAAETTPTVYTFRKELERLDETTGRNVLASRDGGFVVAASGVDKDKSTVTLVFKLDDAGEIVWETTILELSPCERRCLVEAPNGDLWIGGAGASPKLAKLSPKGELLLEKNLSLGADARLNGLLWKPVSGRLAVLSATSKYDYSSSTSLYSARIDLFDADGGAVGESISLGAGNNTYAGSFAVDEQDRIYVAGRVGTSRWIAAYDSDRLVWEKKAGQTDSWGGQLRVVDGDVVVAGSVNERPVLERYSSTGILRWRRLLDKERSVHDFVVSADGTWTGIVGNYKEAELVKFNGQGLPQWTRALNKVAATFFQTLALAKDGGFILTGYRRADDKHYNLVILKTDAAGN